MPPSRSNFRDLRTPLELLLHTFECRYPCLNQIEIIRYSGQLFLCFVEFWSVVTPAETLACLHGLYDLVLVFVEGYVGPDSAHKIDRALLNCKYEDIFF